MFKNLKEYKKIINDIKKSKNIKLDEENREIVELTVADDSEVLSNYSSIDSPVISNEFKEFLESSIKHLNAKNGLHFIISSNEIDDNEKEVYQKAIKNYYGSELIEITNELNRNKWFAIIMTLIGALFFALYLILEQFTDRFILFSIIDVVAWVFIWEAVDILALQSSILRHKRRRCFAIMNSKITYKSID